MKDDARPPIAKAIAYVTEPTAADYTIQADIMSGLVGDKLADAGLVNSRYTLILDGKPDPETGKRTLRITAWEVKPRINAVAEFDWQPDAWYTVKFAVELTDKGALLRCKAWKKGDKEPEKWTLEFLDPHPNKLGAAGLYGYISNVTDVGGKIAAGSPLYFDNLSITPNGK
ncbi:MAG: hypothetical protein K2V38_07315 [Gemmataceae bacterium]|nr:hypothetical protein [Gemmataceae bacterium]